MLNLNNVSHSPSPFSWFILDNVLNEEIFHDLENEVRYIFDNISKVDNATVEVANYFDKNLPAGEANIIGGGSNNDINSVESVVNAVKHGSVLEGFCKEFLNKNLQNRLYRTLVPWSIFDLKSLRPLKVHLENDEMTFLNYIFFKNCYVNLKLSSYSSNFGLAQHKDHGNKITALLFYFGFTDNVERNGCSTQLYEVTKGNIRWSKKESPSTLDYYEKKKLNLVKDIHCKSNRLFGFRKTRHSWHGVDPIVFPSDVRRQALQINLMKHYNSSKGLRKFLLIISKIKGLFRPIVKALLGYK